MRFLAGQRNRSWREAGVALVAPVLAPPQHSDDRRSHGDEETNGSEGDRASPLAEESFEPSGSRCGLLSATRPALILALT